MIRIETSWDDGHIDDLRLATLLKKYNLKAIFYIAPANRERDVMSPARIRQISNEDLFTVGGHTLTHEILRPCEDIKQENEILSGKDWLEENTRQKITSFAYPKGRYNESTIKILRKCDFKEARTTQVGCIKRPLDPFRKDTTVHVYPNRKEYNGENWLEFAKRMFYNANKEGNYYHIWGHSWEITKYSLWDELEQLFKHITK